MGAIRALARGANSELTHYLGFGERDVEHGFAGLRTGHQELHRQGGLARPWHALDEEQAPASEPSREDVVESVHTGLRRRVRACRMGCSHDALPVRRYDRSQRRGRGDRVVSEVWPGPFARVTSDAGGCGARDTRRWTEGEVRRRS